jgi:hypothetical protein
MKEWILIIGLSTFLFDAYGQNTINDQSFRAAPTVDLDFPDSLRQINVYAAQRGTFDQNLIPTRGKLEKIIRIGDDQRIATIEFYYGKANRVSESFNYTYSGGKDIYIEQDISTGNNRYWWHLKDSLIQEIKLLKGPKRFTVARWEYQYINDTLLASIAKFDANEVEKYRIDYEYAEDYNLVGKTIFIDGRIARILETFYDEEGNLSGYRDKNMSRPDRLEEVLIERDSLNHVTQTSQITAKGKEKIWQYENNSAGQMTKAVLMDKDARIEISYDDKGRKIRRQFFKNEKEKSRTDWDYDNQGNLVSIYQYKKSLGTLVPKTYLLQTFDENNLLIRKDYWNKAYNLGKRLDYEYIFK